MSKIKIKNFGPIKEGMLDYDGWIDIKKVTVFIGNQGSGKSTVAKLFSTLSWLEKDMTRGITTLENVNTFKRFQKLLRYQRIDHYLKKESEIEYHGKALEFTFQNGLLTISWTLSSDYALPKIMYVPAERNFLAVVDRPDKLRSLPLPLYTFLDEYDSSRNLYSTGVEMPIGKIQFRYDKQNKLAHIFDKKEGYELRLSEAASGFQSTIPLYLVTKYLVENLGKEKDVSIKEMSLEEQRKQDKIKARIKNDRKLSALQREMRYKFLEALPSAFINIVEEPEQNLFPTSQQQILFSLVDFNNKNEGNRLLMTTHSPYLINYLTLAVKAGNVYKTLIEKGFKLKDPEFSQTNEIVPMSSTVVADDLAIYELNEENGTIKKLPDYKGLPSDENYLNSGLEDSNEFFTQLQEIERGWR
jgi:predicted ATPase